MEDFYETAADDAKRFADLARAAVADGFTAFKSMAVPPTMPLEGLKPLPAAEQAVAAMREAVGESIDIMVDCHARASPAMGLQFAKALDPYDLYFLEEPCWPESIEGLRDIKTSCRTPIATGERIMNLQEFARLIAAGDGEHGRLARIRLLATELRDLRDGACRRSVAARRRQ